MGEDQRLLRVYADRDASDKLRLYSYFEPSTIYISQQRERTIIKSLQDAGINDLSNLKMLDIGCGRGGTLRDMLRYGALPENCHGIDLVPERIKIARELSPAGIKYICGNADALPFENDYFDMVILFTVYSSVLCDSMRVSMASEVKRVLNSNGIILWYDFIYNNPANSDVAGVGMKEIRRLFPSAKINLYRKILPPPIARIIAPYSIGLCNLLERIPLAASFYIGTIGMQGDGG